MKLISCHILGFGKFVNASFDLSKPLVVFKENNGFGKTTLADFIECMFYGLESSRSKSVTGNYRLKYAPWSGGGFGGSLTFFYRGQTYRVERIFGRTAGADVVKIYNQSHALCYEFGEKGERLGETVFGLERESYRKVAYISQSKEMGSEFPESLKARLVALISETDSGQGKGALERLDVAERELRAKRRPGKGKLDVLDEKIEEISRLVEEGKRAGERAMETRRRAHELKEQILSLTKESETLVKRVSESADGAERELRGKILEREEELNKLQEFFGNTDVETLNIAGLESAISQFYELSQKRKQLQEETEEDGQDKREIERLKMQISAKEQALETYTLLLQEKEETTGAGKRSKEKNSKKSGVGSLAIMLGIALLTVGILLWQSQPSFSSALVVGGGVLAVFGMLPHLFQGGKREKEQKGNTSIKKRIADAEKELEDLKFELSALVQTEKNQMESAREELEQTGQRLSALKKAIEEFLSHFSLASSYDYRAALQILKEKKEAYERCLQKMQDYRLEQRRRIETGESAQQNETLLAQKRVLEVEREETLELRAKTLAELSKWENLQRDGELYSEELARLREEKQRLEKRLLAVQTAREILLRARENTASRYLGGVENACAKYARILGGGELAFRLRLLSAGKIVLEENGAFKSEDYYSAGARELLDFCIRLALAETLFTREPPVLMLDDPFVNLDDEKTESAKRLVKELSTKYQVLYFTCKTERVL